MPNGGILATTVNRGSAEAGRDRPTPWRSASGLGRPLLLALACVCVVGLPVLSIFASFLGAGESADTLRHLLSTVIPAAMAETILLGTGVVAGVVVVGSVTAWLAATCEFAGRRVFEWALLLPLAMPAYIVAYAYTDALQFAGPVQTALREAFDWRRGDYWFPEIRSVPGGIFVFTVVLYPYVYLLARTAFLARTAAMIDAARSLGLTAVADVVAGQYSAGAAGDRSGCAARADGNAGRLRRLGVLRTADVHGGDLSRMVFDGRPHGGQPAGGRAAAAGAGHPCTGTAARGRARFFTPTASQRPAPRSMLRGLAGVGAMALCLAPVILGFVLPVLLLLRLLLPAWTSVEAARYLQWLANTSAWRSAVPWSCWPPCSALAYAARAAERGAPARLVRASVRLMSLGYALPGAVVAVGILVPLAGFDNALDGFLKSLIGVGHGPAADGQRVRVALWLPRALLRGRVSVGRGGTRTHHAGDGCQCAQPRQHHLRHICPGPSADTFAVGSGGGAAGVCRRDERVAGDTRAASVQLRHAGRRGLPARGRRASRRGRIAGADHRACGRHSRHPVVARDRAGGPGQA